MYKISFSSYRCIHLCRVVVFEVSVFLLFFIITLFPGGLLPTFLIISIPLLPLPSPFPSPFPPLAPSFLRGGGGSRGSGGGSGPNSSSSRFAGGGGIVSHSHSSSCFFTALPS